MSNSSRAALMHSIRNVVVFGSSTLLNLTLILVKFGSDSPVGFGAIVGIRFNQDASPVVRESDQSYSANASKRIEADAADWA